MTIARRLTLLFVVLAMIPLAAVGLSRVAVFADFRERLDENRREAEPLAKARLLGVARLKASIATELLRHHQSDVEVLRELQQQYLASEPIPSGATSNASRLIAAGGWISGSVIERAKRDGQFHQQVERLASAGLRTEPLLAAICQKHTRACRSAWLWYTEGVGIRSSGSSSPEFEALATSTKDMVSLVGPSANPSRQPRWFPAELSNEPAWVTRCVAPLYAAEHLVGVVGLEIEVAAALAKLGQANERDAGDVFVLDDAGRALLLADRLLPSLVMDDTQRQALRQIASPLGVEAWSSELLKAASRPLNGHVRELDALVTSMTMKRADVVPVALPETRLVAFAPVEVTGWSLGVVFPEHALSGISAAARARIDRASELYARLFVVSLLTAVGLLASLGLWAGRHFSRPITQMIHSIREVSRGGPWNPLVARTGDELQILAESANNMVLALRENERLLADIVNGVNEAIFIHECEGGAIIRVNRHACVMFKCQEEDLIGCEMHRLSSGVEPYTVTHGTEKIRLATEGPLPPFQWQCLDFEGHPFWTEVSLTRAEVGGKTVILSVVRDISERIRMEEKRLELERNLLHTQKLESLGVMAGGIAHDFNNLLTAILGHTELARAELAADAPAQESLVHVESAARRAADLCRQMLAYSGRGKLVTEPLDLSQLVRELLGLLKTAVSKKAELHLNLPEALPLLVGDATQIRQVVLNLILNASDSLRGNSGTITITVSHQHLEAHRLNATLTREQLEPGDYVCLEVTDTGMGMSPATQERIFEPFFTTKFTGRGLGLSAVVGIVKSHHGLLLLSSEEGKGTTFTVAFPVTSTGTSTSTDEPPEEGLDFVMSGTVLLVDDEEPVRQVGVKLLERHGLQALVASDGREALELYRKHQSEISLVLLDMTMPGMDGEQTLIALRKLDPDVRVVMASGFNELETVERLRHWNLSGTLQKPYDIVTLRRVLKKAWPRV